MVETAGSVSGSWETLLYECADGVATVTLNRPHRRNALNRTAYSELEKVFRLIQKSADVRVVIVSGVDPAFCSGEDVKEMMKGEEHARSVAHLTGGNGI